MKIEEWRSVPGFEGYYEASSFGRIRSVDRIIAKKDGKKHPYKGVMLRPGINANGYPAVILHKSGKPHSKAVHKVIASTFLGEGMVDHIDRNPKNNSLENLRIVSGSLNGANRSHSSRYTSPYKGVIENEYGRWRARIMQKTIGSFATAREAALAYDEAALKMWGDAAATNFKLGFL